MQLLEEIELQWGHDLVVMESPISAEHPAHHPGLQWGHDLVVMESVGNWERFKEARELQWGHDLVVMERRHCPESCGCDKESFNGAMTSWSWRGARRRPPRRRPACFNGAMTSWSWRADPRQAVPSRAPPLQWGHDLVVMERATSMPRMPFLERLQWGHDLVVMERIRSSA